MHEAHFIGFGTAFWTQVMNDSVPLLVLERLVVVSSSNKDNNFRACACDNWPSSSRCTDLSAVRACKRTPSSTAAEAAAASRRRAAEGEEPLQSTSSSGCHLSSVGSSPRMSKVTSLSGNISSPNLRIKATFGPNLSESLRCNASSLPPSFVLSATAAATSCDKPIKRGSPYLFRALNTDSCCAAFNWTAPSSSCNSGCCSWTFAQNFCCPCSTCACTNSCRAPDTPGPPMATMFFAVMWAISCPSRTRRSGTGPAGRRATPRTGPATQTTRNARQPKSAAAPRA
mmetsp:Transcript_44146/g.133806  ORF Transcript_44146/g.133806 Transcript_44146/m.133806 type:complete len:285 (+) Transcript_44146:154-1008(+)